MSSTNAEQATPPLRFTDIGALPKRMLAPIEGHEKMPLVSLEDAVKPLVDIVPQVQHNVFVVKQNCQHPADGLSSDESASIMLYTFESTPNEHSLYVLLNTALRSEQRQNLKPWLLYLRLVLTALARLPEERRSVRREIRADLSADYPMGSTCIWWAFSSCTSSVDETTDTRTLFQIDCLTGKDIKNHSFIQQEDEFLLLPARQLQVTSCLNSGNGLHIIQLQERQPTYALLEPVAVPNPSMLRCAEESMRRFLLDRTELRHLIGKCQDGYIVDLQDQNLLDKDITVVVSLALVKKKCSQLWLNKNCITAPGAAIIAESLPRNTTLTRLDLSENRVSDEGARILSTALSQNSSALAVLFLRSNWITDEGAQHIATMLQINTALRELTLSNNIIGDEGMQHLANALTHPNKTLTLLDLLANRRIIDSTVDAFVLMLQHNRTVRTLSISRSKLPENGEETLRRACKANHGCSFHTIEHRL